MRFKTINPCRRQAILIASLCIAVLLSSPKSVRGQAGSPISLTLTQAIDLALKQNRTVHLAQLSINDSEHRKEVARSAYFPHVSNQSSLLHITELAGVKIPAGAFGVPSSTGPIPAKPLFLDQGALTSYTSGTQLAQPITQMFKIRESTRAATADVNTAKVQLTQAENDIVVALWKLYCGLLIAQLKLEAANEQVRASDMRYQENKDAVAKGRALEVAALESHAALLQAKHTLLTEQLEIRDLTLSLNDLLSLPLNSQLQLDPDISVLAISSISRQECLRIAREQSPAILAARQTLLKAKAGLGAAKDAYIPDVTGLARYSYQSGVPLLLHNFGTFGLNLSYELFDGGRRIADIRGSKTMLAQAKVNLDKTIDEVEVAVESAYDGVAQSESLLQVAQESLEAQTEAARVADRQYEQNEALASSRADAHARLASARSALVDATLGVSLAQANLARVTGQLPR